MIGIVSNQYRQGFVVGGCFIFLHCIKRKVKVQLLSEIIVPVVNRYYGEILFTDINGKFRQMNKKKERLYYIFHFRNQTACTNTTSKLHSSLAAKIQAVWDQISYWVSRSCQKV